jgi:hypothetical protein
MIRLYLQLTTYNSGLYAAGLANENSQYERSRRGDQDATVRSADKLINGQTVPDETAKSLIALANTLRPPATTLVICGIAGSDRPFGTATYRIDLTNSGGFRSAVARLLDSRPDTGFLGP